LNETSGSFQEGSPQAGTASCFQHEATRHFLDQVTVDGLLLLEHDLFALSVHLKQIEDAVLVSLYVNVRGSH
jgi:hypothetical protein